MSIKPWLTAISITLVLIASLGFVKFSQIQAAIAFGESFPEPSATVNSSVAVSTVHTETFTAIGSIKARKIMSVQNEYAGVITSVGFEPGQRVEQGQILLILDSQIEQSQLQAAKAREALAKATTQRLQKLLAEDRISIEQVDQAVAELAVSEAEVAQLRAIISKKVIRAMFSGYTGLDQYQVGQLLDKNTAITELIGLDDWVWVDFDVPQTLTQPTIGEQVNVNLKHNLAGDTLSQKAKIIAKSQALDSHSRQQRYRALLNNAAGHYFHNQVTSVTVELNRKTAVSVPSSAISRNHFGNFVYTLVRDAEGDFRAQANIVELGPRRADQQLVLSGIQEGDVVATDGAFKLKQDLLVFTQSVTAQTNAGQTSFKGSK